MVRVRVGVRVRVRVRVALTYLTRRHVSVKAAHGLSIRTNGTNLKKTWA